MLNLVETSKQKLDKYNEFISSRLLKEIEKEAKPLKQLKVFHLNATPRGGGVAEILKSLVPLMKGVGMKAEWYTLPPQNDFFEITKKMHNALQGKNYNFSFSDRKKYMLHMAKTARLMKEMKPDIWVIHDPQPAGVAMFLPNFKPSVLRLHIDLTSPDQGVWNFLEGFFSFYDKIIFSSKDFVKKEIKDKAEIIQPAIDPLSLKNVAMPLEKAKEILRNFDINPNKPLIAQVSRFDPWKDPLGVVEAYRIAKKKIPDLQLALVGLFLAKDDPEAERVYAEVEKVTRKDKDVFLFAQVKKLKGLEVSVFVKAIQTAANVIIQKSTKEGFGLVVTEAMWKEKAVIGGNVGGIKCQIEDGQNGFLVSDVKKTASKIVELIENPVLGKQMGKKARKKVKDNFLMPRLLLDYIKLFKKVI
jgi:trehalose synthase